MERCVLLVIHTFRFHVSRYCSIIIFLFIIVTVLLGQMQRKVQRLTHIFFEESCGDSELAARLLSNFCSQKVVRPYHYVDRTSAAEIVGQNVVDTVSSLKKSRACRKAGGPVDMLRRALVSSSASADISNREVARCFG